MQTATMPTAAGLWMVLIPVAGQGASSSQPFSSSPPRTACAATGDTRGAASVGQDPCHADHAGASLRSSSPVLPSRCATDHSTVSSNDRGWCQRQNILNRWLIWRGTHTDEHNQSAANFLLRVSFLFACLTSVGFFFCTVFNVHCRSLQAQIGKCSNSRLRFVHGIVYPLASLPHGNVAA